jgi:hypothetical protein
MRAFSVASSTTSTLRSLRLPLSKAGTSRYARPQSNWQVKVLLHRGGHTRSAMHHFDECLKCSARPVPPYWRVANCSAFAKLRFGSDCPVYPDLSAGAVDDRNRRAFFALNLYKDASWGVNLIALQTRFTRIWRKPPSPTVRMGRPANRQESSNLFERGETTLRHAGTSRRSNRSSRVRSFGLDLDRSRMSFTISQTFRGVFIV